MNDSAPASKPARKAPEHQPWDIQVIPGVGSKPIEGDPTKSYDSLAECEKACKALALANIGTTFQPVKRGKPFLAEKVEKVVLA